MNEANPIVEGRRQRKEVKAFVPEVYAALHRGSGLAVATVGCCPCVVHLPRNGVFRGGCMTAATHLKEKRPFYDSQIFVFWLCIRSRVS
jgi:hypothetical protein